MAENEPADRPPDHLPALPAPQPPPVLPPGLNADEYRRFQEFQRFQDYQRFVEQTSGTPGGVPPGAVAPYGGTPGAVTPYGGTPGAVTPYGGTPGAVTPYGGTPLHGTAAGGGPPAPAHHEIAEQLAGVRQHLADLATTQARIDRTINPPLWRRILRSRLVHRLIWLGIIVIIGLVGVPLLIENVLGDHNTTPNGNGPPPKEESVMPSSSHDAVAAVYIYVAENDPGDACNGFSLIAEFEFARSANAATCELAVGVLAKQVTDPASYAKLNLRGLPTPAGDTDTISSCEFTVNGGPRLGTFTVTQQVRGWEITGYAPPAPCPAPTTPTH